MLVREHRGNLADSMQTVKEISGLTQLLELIQGGLGLKDIEADRVHVEPYVFDERIGWDTHLILIDGYGAWGMADGPICTGVAQLAAAPDSKSGG